MDPENAIRNPIIILRIRLTWCLEMQKFEYVQYHPIDSVYTVESVKDTVPVIERIFGGKRCEIVVSILHVLV